MHFWNAPSLHRTAQRLARSWPTPRLSRPTPRPYRLYQSSAVLERLPPLEQEQPAPLEPAPLAPVHLHLAHTGPRHLPTWQGRKGPAESSSYSTYAIT